MSRLLARASRRHLLRHPWQIALSVLGVALGVAVVVSVDLAAASAQRAFEIGYQAVAGRASHQVVGGPGGLPEEVYTELRLGGLRRSAPVVEDLVSFAGRGVEEGAAAAGAAGGAGRRTLLLLGLDPFAEEPFRPYLGRAFTAGGAGLGDFLTRPGAAVLASPTARELGLDSGDTFRVVVGTEERRLHLVATVEPSPGPEREAVLDLLVVDLATAQELLGAPGVLSRIDLIADDARAAALAAGLPAGVEIVRAAARSRSAEQMTSAFRLNLRALSLLALLCGAFLIYNTMTFSVVERRRLIGLLRAIGVTRAQVLSRILREAAAVGVAGSLLGVAAGALLGRGLVELVGRTLNDLYFSVAVRGVALDPWILVKGLVLGVTATLVATGPAAREATSAPPRSTLSRSELEERSRAAIPRSTATALVLLALGGALLAFSGHGLAASFAGLFAVLVGCALLVPLATVTASRALAPVAARWGGAVGRLAVSGVAANLSRTGVAIAALTMAVAVTVGVGLMIGSFRSTVERWLALSLPADLYVSLGASPGNRLVDSRRTLDLELPERLEALAGVVRVNRLLRVGVRRSGGDRIELLALGIDERSYGAFDFASGDPATAWPAFRRGEAVLVSEPFSFRTGLGVGDELVLDSPRGAVRLPVAGVFYDYASDLGTAVVDYDRYVATWDDRRLTALSIFARPAADPVALEAEVEGIAAAGGRLLVRSSGTLRRDSLEVFDRTFRITSVLRLLAVGVAFIGVLSAFMALELERARELGILRALGLTRRQLAGLVTTQTGFMGLVAGLLSMPVGIVMAALMIYVINRRSFGWTMPLELEPAVLVQALALGLVAALVAGLYPGSRMARVPPSEALREE